MVDNNDNKRVEHSSEPQLQREVERLRLYSLCISQKFVQPENKQKNMLRIVRLHSRIVVERRGRVFEDKTNTQVDHCCLTSVIAGTSVNAGYKRVVAVIVKASGSERASKQEIV